MDWHKEGFHHSGIDEEIRMKKQTVMFVLLLCGMSFGQNGALMGWQGGAPSDIMVSGPGGIIGHDLSLLMGGLAPAVGTCAPQGYGYNFFTGPDVVQGSQHTYTDGASFGAGGCFYAYNKSAAWCKHTCVFSGKWTSAQLTRTTLTDGTYVYTLAGELEGEYKTDVGTHACNAYATIPVFDESTPIFQGLTSLSYGGLQIIYTPN
jgi:hypothetical protein